MHSIINRPLLLLIPAFLLFLLVETLSAAYRAPACSREGMAAAPHFAATDAAVEVLQKGGNAVDAAIAAAFALSVVEPYHSGLGGGEFALVYDSKIRKIEALDAREYAPAGLTADLFLDPATGQPHPTKSSLGGLAAGVPGSVAGRAELHEKYGKLPWKDVVLPAIRLARDGVVIDRVFAARLAGQHDKFAENSALTALFFKGNKPLDRGDILKQPKLAECLTQISKDKGASFYTGEQATAIVRSVAAAGGILTLADLKSIRFVWREPIHFNYRGLDVYSMPPPSSGGLCLAEIFHILDPFPLSYLGQGDVETLHLVGSAFERAFADRSRWLADPACVPQPVEGMTSAAYAEKLRSSIRRDTRTPVKEAGDPWRHSGNTSHISVIDKDGGMCAITTSVNGAFGSLVFVPELGFFLNNTMDDFALTATSKNIYDLTQGDVNLVEPGKRPLSSMSPTLILKENKPYASIGSVGGPRIITSVAQIIINLADFKMDIQAAIDAPRIHIQWKPETLFLEQYISPATARELELRNWPISKETRWSISQGVTVDWEKGLFYGGADSRGVGSAGPATIP